jgi:hypothetical protein
MDTAVAGQPRTSAQTALDLLTDSGNPLLGPFDAVLGLGEIELQAAALVPCPARTGTLRAPVRSRNNLVPGSATKF